MRHSLPTRVTHLLGIEVPIVQAGMIWVSGARLAAAVSEAGGLGLVGAGSMRPETFRQQLSKVRSLTARPVGVNMPLFYKYTDEWIAIALEAGIRIFFLSGGSPARYTPMLKDRGCTVVQVIGSVKHALKAEQAGCDAVVAEGFEAGGHNAPDETTTLVLVPAIRQAVKIPVIAAGGIATGGAMAASFALGAEGVQVGTRFAATRESAAHDAFKRTIVEAGEGETRLLMKKLIPVRLWRNAFSQRVAEAEARGATREELETLLGNGRARKGIHEGDMQEGEIEIGQVAALIDDIPPAGEIVRRFLEEYEAALSGLPRPGDR
ncbi:MAG: nitronate monooxygenase [bacterium]|nr:nitronate monooxygenase [bacterium]